MRTALKPDARVRVLGAGFALALGAVLTAGCGAVEDSSVAKTVKEAVQTPQQKLIAAAPTTTTEPYTYSIVQKGAPNEASDAAGSINAPGKAYELKTVQKDEELGYTLTMEFRVVDQASWIKINFADADDLGLPEIPKNWMLVDPAKLKTKDVPQKFTEQDEDPGRLGPMFSSIVDATEDGAGKFSGTLDYTKQTTVEILLPETVKALGEKATALPFTATVTDGKVTEFVLSVPAAGPSKAQTYTATYGKYGSTSPIAAPTAAETSETPDFVYELLNG